jgi:hypothetical protein
VAVVAGRAGAGLAVETRPGWQECLTRYYTRGMAGEDFDGIPVGELPIDEVLWSDDRAKHIRTRTERKGPAEINIEPLWASEAALDPNRMVRRGSGRG